MLTRVRATRAQLAQAGKLPRRAADELDALLQTLRRALQPSQVGAAASSPAQLARLADGLEQLRHIHASVRLDAAKTRALAALQSRPGLGRPERVRARAVIDALERRATSTAARGAVTDVLAHIDSLAAPTGFLQALERTLAQASRFADDDFARLLAQATRAAHPSRYLDDIGWLATLPADARHALSTASRKYLTIPREAHRGKAEAR